MMFYNGVIRKASCFIVMNILKLKKKKTELISWTVLLFLCFSLYSAAIEYFVFPAKLKAPLQLCLFLIVCISGVISLFVKGNGRILANALNCILITLTICALIFLPYFEKRIKEVFNDVITTETVINVYALMDDNKNDFCEYSDSIFVIQRTIDTDNQGYAIEQIQNVLGLKNLKTESTEDVVSAAKALYEKQGDLLILNEVYVDLLEEIEGFEHFSDETKVVCSITRIIESEDEPLLPIRTGITDTPFTVYVAGSDTRSGRLSIYGRTDVNLVVNINPNTKQVLIIGIPRDTYIFNPALNYGYDKLTHLGNNSIYNSMKGVSEYFNIEINYYGEVIFDTFKRIVDAVGGLDVDNPYYFKGAGIVNDKWIFFEYPKGTIHLNGDAALAYARERKSLPNGDYDRNEHQTLVLKSFISKVMSPDVINSFNDLLEALKGQFMTDLEIEDIFKLVNMQINDGGNWDIITYHMGGIGDMCGTASMGWDRKLYVVHPFESQIAFVKRQIDLLKRDEIISQEILPQDNETTYILN